MFFVTKNLLIFTSPKHDINIEWYEGPDVFIKQFQDPNNFKEVMKKTLSENVSFKE